MTSMITTIFLVLVSLHVMVQTWLARRQINHVSSHRDRVPESFGTVISAEAHAKAADYTCAKQRFGLVQFFFGVLVLLAWTLGGGLEALNGLILEFLGGGPATNAVVYQVALVFAFSLISGIIELPFEWYANFRIEARFGFKRMTQRLWLGDLA